MSPTGRASKSKTTTSVCSEKISNSKMRKSGIGCGPLNIQLTGSSGTQFENESNVMEALSTDEKFLTYDENMRSALITSPTLILSSDRDKSEKTFVVEFKDKLTEMLYRNPKFVVGDQSYMFYHKFQYRSSTDYSCIKIQMEQPAILGYEVYFRLNSSPNNDTFDYRTALNNDNLTNGDSYHFCVPVDTFQTNGTMYVGLRPFQLPGHQSTNILSKYAFKGFSVNCMAWNGTAWVNDTCKMEWGSSIKCRCQSRGEVTVANSFFVPPNTIDFSTVFQKFDLANNGIVFAVVVSITCMFILLIAWTCRQDRKSKWMGNIWPLCDNKINDTDFYLITVFTGLKADSGTLSNICFILCGEKNTSATRCLNDGIHKGFPTGSLRKFLMSSSKNLGDLIYLRIWSDCSGHGLDSSWYLNKVEIMDTKSEKIFVFRCEGWIATDSYASTIYNISCNRSNDHPIFKSRFVDHIQHSLSDGHLWFSTYVHPCYSTFSRTQRIVCCATVLYLTMITNAMFSPFDNRLKVENDLTIGPIRLNLRQIAVSIQSIAITVPSTLFLVACFKDSKPYGTCCCKKKPNDDEENKNFDDVEDDDDDDDDDITFVQAKANYSRDKFLPFWCVYVGWLWATLVIFTSGFFVILYSLEWGSTKSEYWLTSFAMSNLESFVLIDPGKILLLSLAVAIFRSRPKVKQISYNEYINILNAIDGHLNRRRQIQYAKKVIFTPLDEEARKIRHRKIISEMWYKSVVLNGIIYSLLLISAGYIAYVNQDTSNYRMKESLENIFVHPVGSKYKFTNVKTVKLYFDWMENVVFPNFFPTASIFKKKMVSIEKMYISDGVNIKIGPARLRQLRVKKSENCDKSNLKIKSCNKGYNLLDELKDPFCLQWQPESVFGCPHNESINNLTLDSWKYTPASKINGIPIIGMWNTYGGGGYINNFEINSIISKAILEELIRAKWVDRQTRAVFLEFTLYNANTHMFAYMNFLVEFPESGGAIPYYIISVFRPFGIDSVITIVFQAIFIFCIVLLLIKVIYNLIKMQMSFFSQFWNVIDFFSLVFCIVSLTVFIIQRTQTDQILEEFRQDPKAFVNFYHIVIWNEIISIALAFLIFFAIIRLSCILGVSQTMLQISLILNRCVSHLFGVSFLLCIYAGIYAMLGYLIFGSIWSYRSYSSSLISVFLIVLGKTNYTELNDLAPILGKIYFFSVVFFMIFMLLKMFESVLGECISMKQNTEMEDYNVMLILSKYFRMLREIGKKNSKVSDVTINKKEFV
ncbi:polycystic kidney disease protein 1-like 2 [Octopus bimaculoides]|nr:polycystic kidney disease protein 1-like 2 [Octopus bimaculoides]